MFISPAYDLILGEAIGLARAAMQSGITENTYAILRRALCSDPEDAHPDLAHSLEEEKFVISPGCRTCASRCGNTDAYDLTRLEECCAQEKKEMLRLCLNLLQTGSSSALEIILQMLYAAAENWEKDLYVPLISEGKRQLSLSADQS